MVESFCPYRNIVKCIECESETVCPRPPYTSALTAAPTKSYSFAVAPLDPVLQQFGESAGGHEVARVAPIRYGVSQQGQSEMHRKCIKRMNRENMKPKKRENMKP